MAHFAAYSYAACMISLLATATSHVHQGEEICGGASDCSSNPSSAAVAASLLQVGKRSQHTDKVLHSRAKSRLHLSDNAPCSCEADNADWIEAAPRPPRCIFIDLGAADGNTFQNFLNNGYGNVSSCPSGGAWEAILVEANPIFGQSLLSIQSNYGGAVRAMSSAAYMCEGTTSFYLDTVDVAENFWGSSMSPNTRDVQRSGKKQVTVPLTNVARLIVESTRPEDYVLLKMDIEGAEHDIVPCLVNSRASRLIDAMFVEKHPEVWSLSSINPGALPAALSTLQHQGMSIPDYDSPSL